MTRAGKNILPAENPHALRDKADPSLIVISNFHDYITLETGIPALPPPTDEAVRGDWIEHRRVGVGRERREPIDRERSKGTAINEVHPKRGVIQRIVIEREGLEQGCP